MCIRNTFGGGLRAQIVQTMSGNTIVSVGCRDEFEMLPGKAKITNLADLQTNLLFF